jgi:hypothetical protein
MNHDFIAQCSCGSEAHINKTTEYKFYVVCNECGNNNRHLADNKKNVVLKDWNYGWVIPGRIARPRDGDFRSGFSAQIWRRNIGRDEISYYCGGQFFTESLNEFVVKYRESKRVF